MNRRLLRTSVRLLQRALAPLEERARRAVERQQPFDDTELLENITANIAAAIEELQDLLR